MIPYLKPALIAVTVAGIASGSWMARGWYEGNQDLAALQAQNALAESLRDDLGKVSRDMEKQIAGLKPSETVIDRGIVREIQTEVFRNVCVPPGSDSFRMLNRIANGQGPREPSDQGAEDAADAD